MQWGLGILGHGNRIATGEVSGLARARYFGWEFGKGRSPSWSGYLHMTYAYRLPMCQVV